MGGCRCGGGCVCGVEGEDVGLVGGGCWDGWNLQLHL